ncbi:hypothetical protein Hanom_Chr14g01315831 [Helianthus anomalus]
MQQNGVKTKKVCSPYKTTNSDEKYQVSRFFHIPKIKVLKYPAIGYPVSNPMRNQ